MSGIGKNIESTSGPSIRNMGGKIGKNNNQ
jgi:hypothetical protein